MQTLDELDLHNARALLRVDFNVPLGDDGSVIDDARIRAALPTLHRALERGCACVLMTHLGRPGGAPDERLKLTAVADRLAELIPDRGLVRCDEMVGPRAKQMADALEAGQILLLQNLRFCPGEEQGDAEFAAELASLGDVYINDAFAACHRKHASVYALAKEFPAQKRAIGLLVKRELDALARIVDSPPRPFIAVFGGAKVKDKLEAVGALLGRVDRVLIGGAMAYTFLRARGRAVGASKVEQDKLDAAREILDRAGDKLVLPHDHVMAQSKDNGESSEQPRTGDEIAEGWMGLDIGPKTARAYAQEIRRASTVLWNGPMGKFEDPRFMAGTRQVAQSMAEADATTIVGGGETGQALRRLALQDAMTHVSTGGGAFLDYIAHGTLPALDVLKGD